MKKWPWITFAIVLLGLIALGVARTRTTDGTTGGAAAGQSAATEKEGVSAAVPETETKGKPLPTVTVETVTPQSLARILETSGAVTPTRTARLASPGEGPVQTCAVASCMVREGDRVEKGQVLLQISRNKAARAQMAAAAQALKEQEAELQRITRLVEAGAVPGSQLDAARSKHENARAQLAKAMESAEDYLVAAPWDGIVSKVYVTEGDYVAPRTPLIEIFDPASLLVQFAVPETRSMEIREGLPLQVQLDAYPGRTFEGKISRVYPQLDERTRTRTVEATLTEPVDLIPGMFARIRVILDKISDAVTVPAHSLVPAADGIDTAFVVEDGKAMRRRLTTGVEIDGRVQILSGLLAGDRVIIAGQEKLKDGAAVKVMQPAPVRAQADAKEGGARS